MNLMIVDHSSLVLQTIKLSAAPPLIAEQAVSALKRTCVRMASHFGWIPFVDDHIVAEYLAATPTINTPGLIDTRRHGRPVKAESFLKLFVPAVVSESILGDLGEGHAEISKKFGRRRADVWYRFQIFRLMLPLSWYAIKMILREIAHLSGSARS